jgi:hypothetical protein
MVSGARLENLLGVADGMNRAKTGKLINAENIEASMWNASQRTT